ncbi:hypothetical protein H6F67_00245 [Microcoleus sp. FACHB-1515]|uniref:hypothetical protein n=1 Tax=Cyanophyceae TaxID=3028117 RepID=UPI00168850C3|nr:hypothetical protein [Microcoleus sp. FACHB-1515]MBD2088305.1 hypothetical protein [Microcoleus sp. FACHB-1515]
MSEEISPSFQAIDAEVSEDGIVLIHADEAEAQRSFCEGQLRGYSLRLDGVCLVWLRREKSRVSHLENPG